MLHLPGLVMANQMEKIVKAVSHLGIAVRGFMVKVLKRVEAFSNFKPANIGRRRRGHYSTFE